MKKLLLLSLFMLATLVWAAAQQPGAMPHGSGGQATSPSAQVPDASQQPSSPGSAGQSSVPSGAQTGSPSAAQSGATAQDGANSAVTEGCLGGSNPNYTITDTAGKTYKLNIPPGADASPLASHIGEPVAVIGAVNSGSSSNASIDVNKIGRGTSKCPGSSSSGAQAPPKQ